MVFFHPGFIVYLFSYKHFKCFFRSEKFLFKGIYIINFLKYIIIGLGHFGSSLAEITSMGNEVIGIDWNMGKVEFEKQNYSYFTLRCHRRDSDFTPTIKRYRCGNYRDWEK